MARPLSQFPLVMSRRALQVRTNATRLGQRAAFAVDRSVVLNTPVDTGRARSSWTAHLGAPGPATRPPYAPGMKLGLGEIANASGAIAQAAGVIGRFSAERDQSIVISNEVRNPRTNFGYIGRLNAGHSRQVPPLFVQRALVAGAMAVSGRRLLR